MYGANATKLMFEPDKNFDVLLRFNTAGGKRFSDREILTLRKVRNEKLANFPPAVNKRMEKVRRV